MRLTWSCGFITFIEGKSVLNWHTHASQHN